MNENIPFTFSLLIDCLHFYFLLLMVYIASLSELDHMIRFQILDSSYLKIYMTCP